MKYPQDFINKIVCGDILKVIKQIPDETVDVVVTSPPYNLKNSTGNGMKDEPVPKCRPGPGASFDRLSTNGAFPLVVSPSHR
jgi:hypothetical protein